MPMIYNLFALVFLPLVALRSLQGGKPLLFWLLAFAVPLGLRGLDPTFPEDIALIIALALGWIAARPARLKV
jgi:hypothetical protein